MRYLLKGHRLAAFAGVLLLLGTTAGAAHANDQLAYVADEAAGTVTQVDLTSGTAGAPIEVGSQPDAVAVTPDGSTAYVADYGSSKIVPVSLASATVRSPISLGARPNAIAITPNGKVAYVVSDSGTIWPITLASGRVGNPVSIPTNSDAIAITPAGTIAYITDVSDATISPLALPGGSMGVPINLEAPTPDGIAISPDGSTAYVASNADGTITPISLASATAGTPIEAGTNPSAIAITADGTTAYVTDFGGGEITPIDLQTATPETPLQIGGQPSAIGLVPPGGVTVAPQLGGSDSSAALATVGNQQLSLSVSPPAAATAAENCHAPGSTLRVTMKRKVLARGVKLKLRYVTFKLGKRVKREKRLPVTVRLPLKGLSTGTHTLTARAFYSELLAAHASGHREHRKLNVTISRRLSTRIRVC